MAARRLIIVLLILLGVSIFATALAPVESGDDDPPPTVPEALSPAPTVPEAELPQPVFLNAGAEPRTLPLEVGEAVTLEVSSKAPGIVEIPALGLTQAVDASAPARFDLLPRDSGTYDVRMFEDNRLIGRLKVSPEPARGERPRA